MEQSKNYREIYETGQHCRCLKRKIINSKTRTHISIRKKLPLIAFFTAVFILVLISAVLQNRTVKVFAQGQITNTAQVVYYEDASGNKYGPVISNVVSGTIQATSSSPDAIPPAPPTELKASIGDSQISLSWNNPPEADFFEVRILRRENNYPTNLNDGKVIYEGAQTTYFDAGLENDKVYYYAIFARDEVPNWSSGANIKAAPKKPEPEPNPAPLTRQELIAKIKTKIQEVRLKILELQKQLLMILIENIKAKIQLLREQREK